MDTFTVTVLLVILVLAILVAGVLIKRYTSKRLDDIDGFRGVHKKKDFKSGIYERRRK